MNSHVPAAVIQLSLKSSLVGALPLAFRTCRPGQLNAVVSLSSCLVTTARLVIPSVSTMMM